MAITEALDYVAIRRLQEAYGDTVTRQAWNELIPMFEPECPIRFDLRDGRVIDKIGPVALGAFIAESVTRFSFFAFTPLNAVVDLVPGTRHATGRLYVSELFEVRSRQRSSTLYGVYSDKYAKGEDGRWRFAARAYSALARIAEDGSSTTFAIPEFPLGEVGDQT